MVKGASGGLVPTAGLQEWLVLAEALEAWGPAACQEPGVSPDAWWPVGSSRGAVDAAAVAKRVCLGCAVRWECLAYAVAAGERDGIWGGRDAVERGHLRRAS